jgi:cysteine synthase B
MTALAAVSSRFPSAAAAERQVRAVEVLERIGGTPLVDLSALLPHGGGGRVRVLGKAEMANPGGSVKDRPALAMVLDAEERGLLSPRGGRRILDATSGNTGIAYAMIGAARGYGVTLCLPDNASPERKRMLIAYGADLVLTDPLEGTDGAIREARRRVEEEPRRWAYLDQYSNPANPRAHESSTGPEVLRQCGGHWTHFVTGLGTTGTFMGVGRFLRREMPQVRRVAVQPDGPLHGLEGLKHLETALVPAIWEPAMADEQRTVSTESAYATARRLARKLGLLVGPSAAANVASALAVGEELMDAAPPVAAPPDAAPPGRPAATVVTVLCDGAEKYLSEEFWNVVD